MSFSAAFSKKMVGRKGRFVKSIFSLALNVEKLDVHNVHAQGAKYKLADGSDFIFEGRKNGRVSKEYLAGDLNPFFVVHRMYRSQMEYISLLGRGRPKGEVHHMPSKKAVGVTMMLLFYVPLAFQYCTLIRLQQ